MEEPESARRFRFEEKTSDVAILIQLPREEAGRPFKELLRRFLALLGELARRWY